MSQRPTQPTPGIALGPARGVGFRVDDATGQVSTSAVGRSIVHAAVHAADPVVAQALPAAGSWRKHYVGAFRDLTIVAATSSASPVAISRAGLETAYQHLIYTRDGETVSLAEALPTFRGQVARLESVVIDGTAHLPATFSLPYAGTRTSGAGLRAVVDRWVSRGIAEPSVAAAFGYLDDNPDWWDLRDLTFVVLGAGSQMGPLLTLLDFGATVYAVDLPSPDLWRRLIGSARTRAGRLVVPVPPGFVGARGEIPDEALTAVAGVDLVLSLPEVFDWIADVPGPLVVGSYVYADGGTHVLLSMAIDALVVALTAERHDVSLAWLATPTDAFAVPWECVQESRARWDSRRASAGVTAPLRLAGKFKPNYAHTVRTPTGEEYGIADCLVPQQGPNYALAKRLQRLRGLEARASGIPVSLNVAPSTRTASVVRNRALAAAYAGAHRFGVEIFEPETSNPLMAAMLIHDLRNPASSARPDVTLDTPLRLLMDGAHHGGLWRTAYDPRSVLSVAAVLGLFNRGA